jgi:hypothetical protein
MSALLGAMVISLFIPTTRQAHAVQGGTLDGGLKPIWQTNGTVYALAVVGDVVYAGGGFTSVRPPGSPSGTNEHSRRHLAAFSAATGTLLGFSPDLDGRVSSMAAGPNGGRLYVGGRFRHVGNAFRNHLAAFDTKSGSLVSTWKPGANAPVTALATNGKAVYLGGSFTSVAKQPRSRLAAVSVSGSLLPWTPDADAIVYAIAVVETSVGTRVLIGGKFDRLAGVTQHKIGSVGPVTGAPKRWDFQPVPSAGQVKTIVVDQAGNAYVGVETAEAHRFEGTFSAVAATGVKRWLDDCQGATQSIVLLRGHLYVGSHVHGCNDVAGGPAETDPMTWHHIVSENPATGAFQHFFPNTNGNPLGPRVLATDGVRLFVGGDFGFVNTRQQQGLAKFGPPPPDTTPPGKPAQPTTVSPTTGVVAVAGRTVNDLDDGALSYGLLRDCEGSELDAVVVTSEPWSHSSVTLRDRGLPSGSKHTYCIRVSDGTSARTSAPSSMVTVK